MNHNVAVLQGQGLVVGYGKAPVLSQVDLQLCQGELVGLVGPNGAGKTTLFRVLAGQLRPERGAVELVEPEQGSTLDLKGLGLAARARLGIGYLPQRPALLWNLTVQDNLDAACRSPAARAADRWQDPLGVTALLERFDLGALANTRAAHLSGGQARRLELARLRAIRSRFLLCDEPLTGLDANSVQSIQSLLEQLASGGTGILVADHRTELFGHLCHRLVRLERGTMVAPSLTDDVQVRAQADRRAMC
ncbi:MAG: ATP-binding cassette domain-containing protein [Myxococcota bacterium]